ncbi:MAG: FkbM family methyltransferase [Eubacterium sp.]|nr:FkbM family methyltransferase [Eubacterium sp.]
MPEHILNSKNYERKIKIFLFGVGKKAENILNQIELNTQDIKLLGFIDNDFKLWGGVKKFGKIGELQIYSPQILQHAEFDKLIIMSDVYYEEIRDTLVYWHHIDEKKIGGLSHLIKLLLMEKYKDTEDVEVQELLRYWGSHEISVFNHYIKSEQEQHMVYWDYVDNMPYIMFEDKKMYFPFDYKFQIRDGKKVVIDILEEQQEASPHLYIKDDITIEQGDVIADVGVQEGNFSLRYIEKASKIYLFEPDERWRRPLLKTFEKFKDKVVFCNKIIGRSNGLQCTNLDTVIKGRLDFLKMDIEGAEVEALFGARKTLNENSVKCSVCSYHNSGDEMAIRSILQSYGYQTTHSNGYMLYYFSRDFYSTLDLRRGIVYARK